MIGDGLSSSTASGVPVKFGENLCCHRHHPFASGLPRSRTRRTHQNAAVPVGFNGVRRSADHEVGHNLSPQRARLNSACSMGQVAVQTRKTGSGVCNFGVARRAGSARCRDGMPRSYDSDFTDAEWSPLGAAGSRPQTWRASRQTRLFVVAIDID